MYEKAQPATQEITDGMFTELEGRLTDLNNQGKIDWDKTYTATNSNNENNTNTAQNQYSGLVSTPNTLYSKSDKNCEDYKNKPWYPSCVNVDLEDVVMYDTDSKSESAIIIDTGSGVYAIWKLCGNVSSQTNTLPSNWKTTINTIVDKSTAFVGESATWTGTATVAIGPIPVDIYHGFTKSQAAGTGYTRDSNYLAKGKARNAKSINTTSMSLSQAGKYCMAGTIENDAIGIRNPSGGISSTTTDQLIDSTPSCVTVSKSTVSLKATAVDPPSAYPEQTVQLKNGISFVNFTGLSTVDYNYRLSNTFVAGTTPTWNPYQSQNINSGVATTSLDYKIPVDATAGQQFCRRIEINDATYTDLTVTANPSYADSCVTVGSFASLTAVDENQNAYRGDIVTLRNIVDVDTATTSGSGTYGYSTSYYSINPGGLSVPSTTADTPNPWVKTGTQSINADLYDNVKFTIPNDAPIGSQYCRKLTINRGTPPPLLTILSSTDSSSSCVTISASSVKLNATAGADQNFIAGTTPSMTLTNGITATSPSGADNYTWTISDGGSTAPGVPTWTGSGSTSIYTSSVSKSDTFTASASTTAGQKYCRKLTAGSSTSTLTVTANSSLTSTTCAIAIAPNATTLKATATPASPGLLSGTFYRGSSVTFTNGISVISPSGSGTYKYKKSTAFKLGTTPSYDAEVTKSFGDTVSDIETAIPIPNTANPGEIWCVELVIPAGQTGVTLLATDSGYLGSPAPAAGTSRSCVTISASSVTLNAFTDRASQNALAGTTGVVLTNGITASNQAGNSSSPANYSYSVDATGSLGPNNPVTSLSNSRSMYQNLSTSDSDGQQTITVPNSASAGDKYCRTLLIGSSTTLLTITSTTSSSSACVTVIANDSAQINARSSASVVTAYPGDTIEFKNWASVPAFTGSSSNQYSFTVTSTGDYTIPNTPALVQNQSVSSVTSTINTIRFQIPNDGTILAGKKYCATTTINSSSFTITSSPGTSESCVTIGGSSATLKATGSNTNAYPGDTVNLQNGVEIVSKNGAGAYTYNLTDDGSNAVKPSGWTDWTNLNGTGTSRIEGSNLSVPFAINIPVNATASTKYCRKITINDSSANPTLTLNPKTATSCINIQSAPTWNISPSIVSPAQDYSIGDNITFTYNLNITGTTPNISIPVTAANSGKASGTTTVGSIAAGSADRTVTFNSSPIRVNSYGSYCTQLTINNYASGSWTPSSGIITAPQTVSSEVYCVEVSVKPRVNIIGGDLTVGKGTAGDISANTKTNWTYKGGQTYGSWVEYGLFGTNTIYNMSSAAQINGGIPVASCNLISNMTFSNITTAGGCGGSYSYKSNMKNYKNLFKTDQTISNSSVNLDSLNGNYSFTGTSLNISSNSAITGKSVIINAPNATVFISSNINRVTTGLNPTNIPQVVIIAKNIKIKDTVTNIDSWLLAPEGNVDTCSSDASTNPTSLNLTVNTCSSPLTINGPLVANKLYLLRTAGANPSDVAEKISLPADSYLWLYNRSKQNSQYYTTYTRTLPARL